MDNISCNVYLILKDKGKVKKTNVWFIYDVICKENDIVLQRY